MVEDILSRCGNVRSIEKSLSSVSLRLTALPDKASTERGGARRRRAEGFVPLRREGRGGSVSRRDHNSVYRRRAQLSGGTPSEERVNPNASRSSGEGVWGRGASLREAASPPESSPRHLFGREREGGAFSSEKAPPSHMIYCPFILFAASLAAWATASPALSFSLPAMVT